MSKVRNVSSDWRMVTGLQKKKKKESRHLTSDYAPKMRTGTT